MTDKPLSQDDIDIRDFCEPHDSWEHAIGYLMYAAEFPTRIDLMNTVNAFDVVFPNRLTHEWAAFYQFQENIKGLTNTAMRLVEYQKKLDRLYYQFSQEIKKWLERGIPELSDEDIVNDLRDWRNTSAEIENARKLAAGISSRTKKEASKKAEYKPYKEGQYVKRQGWQRVDYPDGTRRYRPVRYCKVCESILPKWKRFYCSDACSDEAKLQEEPDLVAKYFPNAHKNGT
jgi:hypothetical protein